MKSKSWLKESSFAYATLKKNADKRLLNDLKYLTDFNHNCTLEVYHTLYKKYSPKHFHLSYPFMIPRAQLAVLDFNSGFGWAHRKNEQRDLQYKHQFSKFTQSWSLKNIRKERKGNVQKSYNEQDKASANEIR